MLPPPSIPASTPTNRLPARGRPLPHEGASPIAARTALVADDKHSLRLHVQSLTDTDIAKVATFLRIGRERLSCDWKIVFDGELDVLMLGSGEPDTVHGMLDSPWATLRVVDANPADRREVPGRLVRPLQYEPFIDTLAELEQRYAGGIAKAAPAVIAPPPSPVPSRSKALPPGARLRLRRWPAHALLQGDRDRSRLASFLLSARHVDLDELARLSNVGRPECESFVATLMAAGMLEVTPAEAPRPAPATTTSNPPAAPRRPGSTRSLDEGLFGKIRRGLGLTWQR